MSGTVIGDEVIQLRPLSADDAKVHLAGSDRAIVDSLGGGEADRGAGSALADQERDGLGEGRPVG